MINYIIGDATDPIIAHGNKIIAPRGHTMTSYYIAGGHNHPGTTLPANVTGDCPHHHRTAGAAQKCIEDMDRKIKRGHGAHAYCDRTVIAVVDGVKQR